ncbi:iron ABC transporter permease [Aciduricibacillus chroicocephali]|uniref:Iron ABC transporter permease n=1 Tax=Aciduricibacillus chroicocephali TaxID=3054939 RepID=A0ABY9KV64_9BACI|nr:iron ABC transporter permease [Bacillaceae bacterium 44XB]
MKKRENRHSIESKRGLPFVFKLIAAMCICVAAFLFAIVFGAAHTGVRDVWDALFAANPGKSALIIKELRLPRETAAVLVGAALAVSGAIMQGMTKNPLADPGLFGLTAGANAALAVMVAFLPKANYFYIMIACFIGAGIGALLVFGISALKRGGFTPFRIVLAGAAVSAFLFAVAEGIGLYFKVSRNVSAWTAGGLIGTTWLQIRVIAPFIIVGILVALMMSRQLTILSMDEGIATGLGQRTGFVKVILFIIIVLLSGTAVSLAGNLAFVGLMIPHLVRPFTGSDYRQIIPFCIFAGGAFMLVADTIGRTIQAPFETPVASIVAVIGLPFFLFIVRKGGRAFQ